MLAACICGRCANWLGARFCVLRGVMGNVLLACTAYSLYTVFQKVVHQAHIDNLVNSQRIFKIPSLAHSLENLR